MNDLFDLLDDRTRSGLRRGAMPEAPSPMLATLTDDYFDSADWIYERKLDGIRLLGRRQRGAVRLLSRNGQRRERGFPEVAEALAGDGPELIVDGEVVAFQGKVTSFERLQGRMGLNEPDEARATGIAVHYYIFDLLFLDGYDTTRLPLRARKTLLRAAVDYDDPIRYCIHRNEHGLDYFREACGKGWEGLIAKRAASRYVHQRSRDWRKFKCVHQQELVIGGWTEPRGSREGFGALLLGYHEEKRFRYAGRVGTGFSDEQLVALHRRLERIERRSAPFDDPKEAAQGESVHWATPRLVAEIGFTEWTRHGRLRHPRFLGLRDDKPARTVVRERPT